MRINRRNKDVKNTLGRFHPRSYTLRATMITVTLAIVCYSSTAPFDEGPPVLVSSG
jgi:hypothetical protein